MSTVVTETRPWGREAAQLLRATFSGLAKWFRITFAEFWLRLRIAFATLVLLIVLINAAAVLQNRRHASHPGTGAAC